jgi:hypothetical protein
LAHRLCPERNLGLLERRGHGTRVCSERLLSRSRRSTGIYLDGGSPRVRHKMEVQI